MDVKEAFEILKAEGIINNIQSVRRWIREGKLKATTPANNYKKEGYDIKEKDLEAFILTKLPPVRLEEYKQRKQLEKEKDKYKDILEFISKKAVENILNDPEHQKTLNVIKESGNGLDFLVSLVKPSVKTAVEIMGEFEKIEDANQKKEGE